MRAKEPSAEQAEFFEKEVRPLLAAKCWECHGGSKPPKAGLRLTSRVSLLGGGDSGPAIVEGNPSASLLITVVRYEHEPKMPPKEKLTERQIEALTRWVSMGAPWPGEQAVARSSQGNDVRGRVNEDRPRFWSFLPVKPLPPPTVRETSWPRSEVDSFILAALEQRGLSHAPPADRRTLIRRATFDLIGLPPTPEEVGAFLTDDSPDAFSRVVDRLLASPHYGVRWGRHWLDNVRYADARDLIQLPAESDFRESWRYRDWVIKSFNHDLPYTEFIRAQLAGDRLPPSNSAGINVDGLVATGLLAMADFVPGDVDKEQMIADYVNDQIDVVGRTFMGLTIACARCHDHKFDPISTEDYYALAGIFFSTRLIPGPVPGNTPLVRVPLLSPAELARIEEQDATVKKRRAELEAQLPDSIDRAYVAHVRRHLLRDTVRYLLTAGEYRQRAPGTAKPSLDEVAWERGLNPGLLAEFIAYLDTIAGQPLIQRPPILREIASGQLHGTTLKRSAMKLQAELDALADQTQIASANSPQTRALEDSCSIRLHADDPHLSTDANGRVTLWPNHSELPADARLVGTNPGPSISRVSINGRSRTVLKFDGQSLLEIPRRVPRAGTLIVVFQAGDQAKSGQRLLGWEDSDTGRHGLGLMLESGGRLHAILRNNGQTGDLIDARPNSGFQIVCLTWGPKGTTLHRDGVAVGSTKSIDASSSDPAIASLRLGGPGSGRSPRFHGYLAAIHVYDRQLDEADRRLVESRMRTAWFDEANPNEDKNRLLTELFDELLSARGPFWISADDRTKLLPAEERSRLETIRRELEMLRKKLPTEVPKAVTVQEGGPKGTRHEGFHDALVLIRGNHKKQGKIVPRGVPRVLVAEGRPTLRIKGGSGRLELADWLASADNPLTARVMVNRIWQHHFGEGLVRSPNDFGERGERPTNPTLLDFLASRFMESGWSVKAMHRIIMRSSVYQQSSCTEAVALELDPDNRLFGRMNRRRIDAEEIRDSLLAVAGRLDTTQGGPSFADITDGRRSMYLQSVRTGPSTTDFGRLFDRADPGSIVAGRGESVVAPQALFFLNDPFVGSMARALASRVAREGYLEVQARIGRVYELTLGRPPSSAEKEIGLRLIKADDTVDAWERYCHLILCQNEFLYLD